MIDVKIFIKNAALINDVTDNSCLINEMSNITIEVIPEDEEGHDFIDLIDDDYTLYLKIKNMIDAQAELAKIDKKINELNCIIERIDMKLNNKDFIERAPSDIINQNISNRTKIANDVLSLKNLRNTLSD